jgi:hypothetical protein
MATIPDEGKIQLLESQYTFLQACKWGLFTTDLTITTATVWADIVEATWTGYARVTVGTLNAAAIVGTRASTNPAVAPTFSNGDVSNKTYYGWFMVNAAGTKLVDAVNLGLQTLLAGGVVAMMMTVALKGE